MGHPRLIYSSKYRFGFQSVKLNALFIQILKKNAGFWVKYGQTQPLGLQFCWLGECRIFFYRENNSKFKFKKWELRTK